jgi:hypothetical protein
MKYLRIENNKGYFQIPAEREEAAWNEIDTIAKEDLMQLNNKEVEGNFEMDVYAEDKLANTAHQIIYKRIYEKFTDLLSKRDMFADELESTYKSALEKYSPAKPAVGSDQAVL